jgi:outer membrane protein assembly factor BamA
MRLFVFANAGTLAGLDGTPATAILRSTRAAAGGGLVVGTPMGRLEATYAVPLRYGPRDARRSVQFGLGFSFG